MGVIQWLGEHWFDCVQIIGVVGSLLFTAYSVRKDERARQISNLIALNERHDQIWRTLYTRPGLSRILRQDVDLKAQPVSEEELLFVKMLFIHLDTVRRTSKAGMLGKIGGVRQDITSFISLPIPKAVWERLKPFQDSDLVAFVDGCLNVL